MRGIRHAKRGNDFLFGSFFCSASGIIIVYIYTGRKFDRMFVADNMVFFSNVNTGFLYYIGMYP